MRSALLVALFASVLPAADPGGWTAAKWDMSEAEILAAFPDRAVRLEGKIPILQRSFDGVVSVVGIPAFDLGPDAARIFFICPPPAGALRLIKIEFSEPSPEAFARIESLLVQRYGRPWHRTTAETEQSQWTFPSTTITLRRVQLRNIILRSLWLTYEHRTPDAAPPL